MTETETTTFEIHPKTGRPIQPHATFEVGDLVTEHIASDGYPGVVVHATAKTVYVQRVSFIGSFTADDVPGYNGYGDSGSIVVDPESVADAIADGKDGATKYTLYTFPIPTRGSAHDDETYDGSFHRTKWRRPGSTHCGLSKGARFRQDPHF